MRIYVESFFVLELVIAPLDDNPVEVIDADFAPRCRWSRGHLILLSDGDVELGTDDDGLDGADLALDAGIECTRD